MSTELTSTEQVKKFEALYGESKEASPVRRVKLSKMDKKMSYYYDGENYEIEGDKLDLTIIAINRKYDLKKFDGKTIEYFYSTTEFPFNAWGYGIKVMEKTADSYEPITDEMPAQAFRNYCIARDEELDKTRKPYTPFSKMYKEGKGSAFQSIVVVYGLDKDDNLYRIEMKSGSLASIKAAQKKFTNKIPFYNLTTIQFESESKEGPSGQYYDVELIVGKEHSAQDKAKYIGKADEFLEAVEARRAFFENKNKEDQPKQIEETKDEGPKGFDNASNIDGIL